MGVPPGRPGTGDGGPIHGASSGRSVNTGLCVDIGTQARALLWQVHGVVEGLCSKYGSHVAHGLSSRLKTPWSGSVAITGVRDRFILDSKSGGDTESNAGYDWRTGQRGPGRRTPLFPSLPSISLLSALAAWPTCQVLTNLRAAF